MAELLKVDHAEAERQRLGEELDLSYQKLSTFVCKHGPDLLTVGMPPLRANQALLACLERLLAQRDTWESLYKTAKQWVPSGPGACLQKEEEDAFKPRG